MREMPLVPVEQGGGGGAVTPHETSESQPELPKLVDNLVVGDKSYSLTMKEGTILHKGYEKANGVFQKIADRVRTWMSPKMYELINERVAMAGGRETKALTQAEKYKAAAEDGEEKLERLEAELAVLGTGASSGAIKQLRKEIEENRAVQKQYEEKARARGERLTKVRAEKTNHETKVNAAITRLNQPLEAKQAVNQKEIDFLKVAEAKLAAKLEELQKELDTLQAENEKVAREWRALKRGGAKTELGIQGRMLAERCQVKADRILRLERELDGMRGRIFDLEERNRDLVRSKRTLLGVPVTDPRAEADTHGGHGHEPKETEVPKKPAVLRPRPRRRVAME